EADVRPAIRALVQKEGEKGASLPVVPFPADGAGVGDSPRLTLVLMDPSQEWTGAGALREQGAEGARQRGTAPRLFPRALGWCFRKEGGELRDKVETWLAWRRVSGEMERGELGAEYDRAEIDDVQGCLATAEEDARDEVWASYRYVVIAASRPAGEGQGA